MGKIYNKTAYDRIQNLLTEHQSNLNQADKALTKEESIARYGVILLVSVLVISVFAYSVKKKK